ncbi:MAG TPA: protein kinase [Terriglobales bacterium]|nr:protein kinase [Terriglobales bacterium]
METEQEWARVKELFGDALEKSPEQRDAFLLEACGSDARLRDEVESLLRANDSSISILEKPANALLPSAIKSRSIGPYQLLEKLGEGGMGQVWLAEQTTPLHRRVALKLIRWAMYDDALLHRFQAERQSLAVMHHPSIAKVFDAGATPEGQPYFVMEYVPGLPITEYCDQKKLKIRDRLELFIKVCEGVQHAHQKAIIHRDLKPANILVSEVDGRPVPRIIDFGLAKTLDAEVAGQSIYTHAGMFLGTPGYMSPEQCDPTTQDVDTRTDVYSLGVILYVLLTGEAPFDASELKKKPFAEMLRAMREQDPPRPSTKISSAPNTMSATAEARDTEARQLVSQLRGDLDWITMKAVEKDRIRRYATASDLAQDIVHYLCHEPVTARPTSVPYRAWKYVRRHRIGVAVGSVIGALLIAFGIFQGIQLRRITRERDRADRIAEFMTGIFKTSDPSERLGGTVTAAQLLDKAAKDISTGLSKDPELQTSLMHVIGRAYMYQGLWPRSQSLFEGAIKASSSVGQQEGRETLLTMHDLAWTLLQEGRTAEALRLERELVDTQTRVLGPDHIDTLASISELAFTLCLEGAAGKEKCAEAAKLNGDVLEKQKRVLGPEAHYTIVTMDNQAIMLAASGQPAEAEKLERQALWLHMKIDGEENLATINCLFNLGEMQREEHHDQEAMESFRHALDVETRVLGPNQPEIAVTKYDLATMLARNGKEDEALSLLRDAIDHGYPPRMAMQMSEDSWLNPLHGDPRFQGLVAHVNQLYSHDAADTVISKR